MQWERITWFWEATIPRDWDISRAVSSIDELDIPREDKEKIFGENAKKILKL